MEESECVHCGAVLVDPIGRPKDACPVCGKTGRKYLEKIEERIEFMDHWRIQGKHLGGGKPFFDDRTGASFYKKDGIWHHLVRLIDRENDRYVETVKIPSTGEIIRHVDEKLSDHIGHGSDKRRPESDLL